MKTYKNLYPKLCSYKNLRSAFKKASKGKRSMLYVIEFERNLDKNLLDIKKELKEEIYRPHKLTKFIIRDPKTRVIRKSLFKDRIVHHAIVNILEPIYEGRFISDNFANRVNKGTIAAIQRFDKFKRKVSKNGKLVKNALNNNMVRGYVLKADMRKFFDSVDQAKLIEILRRKIKDEKIIWLVTKIIKNFDNKRKGMPLGNMTSQFFANVYLHDLDQFIKRKLKMKYYLRYVDDFVILHERKDVLEDSKDKIEKYLKNLKLELHPDKSKIYSLYKGVDFLGFKIFYHYKRARKRNVKYFKTRLKKFEEKYNLGEIDKEKIIQSVEGWFAYIMWGDTYRLRKKLAKEVEVIKECKRVIKPTGTIWLNLGDSYYSKAGNEKASIYLKNHKLPRNIRGKFRSNWLQHKQRLLIPSRIAIKCQDDLGLILRNDITWVKQWSNFRDKSSKGRSLPSAVNDRLTTNSEYLFFFVKRPKYYFNLDSIRIPYLHKGGSNPKGKNPGDCIIFPLEPSKEKHFAMFPSTLPEFCIKAGCPERVCSKCGMPKLIREVGGNTNAFNFRVRDAQKQKIKHFDRRASDKEIENYNEKNYISRKKEEIVFCCKCKAKFEPGVVLDPFMGSGTTALVAQKLGRNFIGFEINKTYIKLALRRLRCGKK